MNETKLVYICMDCKKFEFHTRTIGSEPMPPSRRLYCYKCGQYTLFELDKNSIDDPEVQSND